MHTLTIAYFVGQAISPVEYQPKYGTEPVVIGVATRLDPPQEDPDNLAFPVSTLLSLGWTSVEIRPSGSVTLESESPEFEVSSLDADKTWVLQQVQEYGFALSVYPKSVDPQPVAKDAPKKRKWYKPW